jgi:predicted PurR-regulated permease PerM
LVIVTQAVSKLSKSVASTVAAAEPSLSRRRISLSVLAAAALAVLLYMGMPVAFGLFLGALLGFVVQPWYGKLLQGGYRPGRAALLCSVLSSVAFAGILFGLGYLIVSELTVLTQKLPQELAPGGSLHAAVTWLETTLREQGIDPNQKLQELRTQFVPELGAMVLGVLAFSGELVVFFIMMTMAHFNILLRWKKLIAWAERDLPLNPEHTRKLLREFQHVGRRVVMGTVVTGLIQGVVGGLVCWICGVPNAAFFGAVTACLSPIPVVGSLVVWAGVGVGLMLTGQVAAGIAELILGALFVSVLGDDFIRPKLVGGGDKYPALLTFIGLFGGVAVFGLSGLIVGPIVVALCDAVLKIYTAESEPVAAREATDSMPSLPG